MFDFKEFQGIGFLHSPMNDDKLLKFVFSMMLKSFTTIFHQSAESIQTTQCSLAPLCVCPATVPPSPG